MAIGRKCEYHQEKTSIFIQIWTSSIADVQTCKTVASMGSTIGTMRPGQQLARQRLPIVYALQRCTISFEKVSQFDTATEALQLK